MMSSAIWIGAIASIPVLILVHSAVAPYTKVEESFNIQAVHDILTFGIPLQNATESFQAHYDHMTFPGAVPRTFIGALFLAGLSRPMIWWNNMVDRQALARAVLGLFNAIALIAFASRVKRAFGQTTAIWYLLFQASQFHVIYYASRPLPNMFAFGLSTIAMEFLLPKSRSTPQSPKETRLALFLLTVAGIIFRSELALLLGCYILILLVRGQVSLQRDLIPIGLVGVLVGLGLTVPIDTYFWQSPTPLWPELSAFLSNVFPPEGSEGASAWGTSPWHWYFTSALPRLLMNPATPLLILTSILLPSTRPRTLPILLPPLLYTVLYSLLPHKETRFVLYVVPPLTLASAISTTHISRRRHDSPISRLLTILILASTLLSGLLSHALLLPLSAQNYPGGHALHLLHTLAAQTQPSAPGPIAVHLDNLALQTGVTRFLQDQHSPPAAGWRYDKSDNATARLAPAFWASFDYVVTETPGRCIGSWDVVGRVHALAGVSTRDDTGAEGAASSNRSKRTSKPAVAQMYGAAVARWWDAVVEEGVRDVWEATVARRVPRLGGRWPVLEVRERLWVLKKGSGVEV